jgi:hypothetical protein
MFFGLDAPLTCLRQSTKPKFRVNMKTLEEIKAIATTEKERLSKNALVAGGVGKDGQKLRAVMAGQQGALASASKSKPGLRSEGVVEVYGDESRTTKGVVDSICITYILWGNSQKVQLAGVGASIPVHRETFSGPNTYSQLSGQGFRAAACDFAGRTFTFTLPGPLKLKSYGFCIRLARATGQWQGG